ncbi:hypothetical protein Q7P36_007768 [Cladosporium allicinum]
MPGRFPPSVSPHGSSAFWPGGNDTFLVVMLLSKIWLLTPEHAVVMVAVVAVGLVGLHGGMPHAIKRSGRCLDKTSFRTADQSINLRILGPVTSRHLASLMCQSHQSDAETSESSGYAPIPRSELPYEYHSEDEERRSADLEFLDARWGSIGSTSVAQFEAIEFPSTC